MSFPIIDLKESDHKVSRSLGEAFEERGFAYLKNFSLYHDSDFNIDDYKKSAFEFFNLSFDVKMKYASNRFNKKNLNSYRGYFPAEKGEFTYKEGIEFGVSEDASIASKFYETNLWPTEVLNFKCQWKTFALNQQNLGMKLISLLGQYLNQSDLDFIGNRFSRPVSTLRLLHYPNAQSDSPQTKYSTPTHVDSGLLTLLYQDETGGLEAKDVKTKKWIPVPFIEDTLVLNIGALMQYWSGDRFKATDHRVCATSKSRLSLPFFLEPNHDALFRPLQNSSLSHEAGEEKTSVIYHEWLDDHTKAFLEY